jgi:PAS domain S-box-containing protein
MSLNRFRLPLIGLVTALPLAVFAIAMVGTVNRQQRNSVEDTLRQAVAASVRSVDERILSTRTALDMLGAALALNQEEEQDIAERVARALDQRPDWQGLEIVGGGRSTLYRTGETPETVSTGRYSSPSQPVTVLQQGEPLVGSIIDDPAGGREPEVAVSVPVLGVTGTSHVLTAHVRAWSINRALREQGVIPGWLLTVIDGNQKFVARSMSDSPRDPLLGTLPDQSVIEGLRGRSSSFFYFRARTGEHLYGTAAQSPISGWTIVLGAPAADIERATRRNDLTVYGGAACALLLALVFGWSLARAYAKRENAERRLLTLKAASAAGRRSAAILESTTDAVCEMDRSWRITFINSNACRIIPSGLGVTGQLFWDAFPGASTEMRDRFKHAMDCRQPGEFEASCPPLEGWFTFRLFPTEDGGLAVYFRDVSAQRQAEEALRASEAQYRTLVETLPLLVWTCSSDGGCDFASGQWLKYTGLPEAEHLGDGWLKAVHPDDRSRLFKNWQDSVRTGTIFDTDTRLRRFDGAYRWFKQRAIPLRGPDGGMERWFGTSTDITDVIEARNAMQMAKELAEQAGQRFRTMIDSIPQLAWMTRPEDFHFWYNKRWFEYTGTTPEQMEGEGWRSVHHPDHIDRVIAGFQRCWNAGEPWEDTFPLRGADGRYRWFLTRALPVRDVNGRVVLWFGTNTDVTANLEAEDALRRAKEEAEEAVATKVRFLAAASHDLRQPTQSLFLFAGSLHAHVHDDRGREALGHLERGLDALKSLLDSLLDMSRLDAGVVKPTIEEFPLQDVLDLAELSYAPVAKAKGLTWNMTVCSHQVRSDRVLLGRMMRNLIENAIRYTEQGTIEVRCQADGSKLRIEVADTGIGIAGDQLRLIFEEFHQVANQERDRSQGFGLGLAIAQRIGRLLDHPVEVRSEPGKGSVFSIEVPLGAAVQAPDGLVLPEHAGHTDPPPEDRFVVVIDDDAIVLLGLQAILREWGCEVLSAGSGERAMEKLRTVNRKPDIVLADYRLRGGKVGTDAILAIRELFKADIPGIIVTGETGPECQHDAAQHGFGLIHKPVTSRQLNGAIEHFVKFGASEVASAK